MLNTLADRHPEFRKRHITYGNIDGEIIPAIEAAYPYLAETQKADGICALMDCIRHADPNLMIQCGVNVEELYIAQPDNDQQTVEIVEALMSSGVMTLIVIAQETGADLYYSI